MRVAAAAFKMLVGGNIIGAHAIYYTGWVQAQGIVCKMYPKRRTRFRCGSNDGKGAIACAVCGIGIKTAFQAIFGRGDIMRAVELKVHALRVFGKGKTCQAPGKTDVFPGTV